MPGETRNYSFKLPTAISAISSINVRFFQNEEKVVEYDDSMAENVYQPAGEDFVIMVTLPREDTLKFENRMKAYCQIEWVSEGYHSVAKKQRITVGDYLNKEYI